VKTWVGSSKSSAQKGNRREIRRRWIREGGLLGRAADFGDKRKRETGGKYSERVSQKKGGKNKKPIKE